MYTTLTPVIGLFQKKKKNKGEDLRVEFQGVKKLKIKNSSGSFQESMSLILHLVFFWKRSFTENWGCQLKWGGGNIQKNKHQKYQEFIKILTLR